MNDRTNIVIRLISTHIILLPLLISASFFTTRDSYLVVSILQSVLLILFLSGYWEFFGFRFKVTYSLLMEFLLIIRLIVKVSYQHPGEKNPYLVSALLVIQAFLLYELIKMIITIFKKEKEVVEIEFPFKNGQYLVTDGGNSRISRLMNYHFYSRVHKKNGTSNSMLFATDIVKIGNSGKRFLPHQNEDYPIFGEKVFSPIGGKVMKIENNIDDNIPYCGNYPYNTGNTIVIRDENRYLLLGHLKKGSTKVKVSENVMAGEIIAEAGNSGYSERPHIHMQLIKSETDDYWKGKGVSIQFSKRNLFKNRVITITHP